MHRLASLFPCRFPQRSSAATVAALLPLAAGLPLFVALAALAGPLPAQDDPVRSGPMVGYGTMREVLLWVQTTRAAVVSFVYWDAADAAHRYRTAAVRTDAERAFTAKLIADSVQPGRRYEYELRIGGRLVERPYPLRFQTPALWQWRTDPPPLRVATGSCNYVVDPPYDRPGAPYGGDYQIFGHIADRKPDLMLWLGDDAYLREADWNSRTGILYRYTHTRSLPELQPLLASAHHYAIWDDHDFGPDNSDRSWWNKETTLEAFTLFWGNPCFGVEGRPGTTCSFEWSDVQFFLLDNRYYRTPDKRVSGERRTILGDAQREWLIDALVSSRATFKIVVVGGQVLNPHPAEENYANFPAERDEILAALEREQVAGVIFLSGDKHWTELSRLERTGTYPLYDLTVSPLTAGLVTPGPNPLLVEGTRLRERNFAVLDFDGPRDDRRLTLTVIDKDGIERWSRTISARELR